MALLPFTLIEPNSVKTPLVVDVPHSGRIYPVDFAYDCPLPMLRQSEDAYVDEVVSCAPESGATVLVAEFPRSMIDANRAEDDIDPASLNGLWTASANPTPAALSGFGLVRRLCGAGASIYRAPLPVAEAQRRIETYYRPYHACLNRLVQDRIDSFGFCVLLDTHSMPSRAENNTARPDFVLGDLNGTSCAPEITERACEILSKMGYSVALNDPYKGREILRRYGNPQQGAHALQIEINRSLYLDETALITTSGLQKLRTNMTKFFHACSQTSPSPSTGGRGQG